MFTIRVNWNAPAPQPMLPPIKTSSQQEETLEYSVYHSIKYTVARRSEGGKTLYIDSDPQHFSDREVYLAPGDKAYVMNDHGATVDTIIV